jgi:hypothetical protein
MVKIFWKFCCHEKSTKYKLSIGFTDLNTVSNKSLFGLSIPKKLFQNTDIKYSVFIIKVGKINGIFWTTWCSLW